jgi:hypothetical protein
LRVLLAELERLYNHLHYLGFLAETTTLKVGAAEGKLLEERAKQLNARLTGSRFLRNVLMPGGFRRDLDPGTWLAEELERLREEIAIYVTMLERTNSYRDRLMTTGILPYQIAFDQGATGPIKRASGIDRDLRRDHIYAGYADLPLVIPTKADGDAHAREQVRIAEIDASIVLMQRVLLLLEPGPVQSACLPMPLSEGLGWALGVLCRAFRRRRTPQAREDQIAVILELARVPLHGSRREHDGLRDQRGEFRPHYRRLRQVGHDAVMDTFWIKAGQGDDGLAAPYRIGRSGGRGRHAALRPETLR